MTLTQTPFVLVHLLNAIGGKLQVLQSAGQLATITAQNQGAGTVYLQFFDFVAQPSNGATPTFAPVPLPAGTYYESDAPRGFVNGCWVCVSTTATTLTANGTDLYLDAGGLHN